LFDQLTGDYVESFVSKHLVKENGLFTDTLKQDYVKWASEALYIGGGDTVNAQYNTYIHQGGTPPHGGFF
jgi:hypothetical protein